MVTQQTTFPDGGLQEQYSLRNGEKHGLARTWCSNRVLASQGHYVGGKREGTWLYFTETGAFAYQILYISDEEVWRSTDRAAKPDRQAIVETKFTRPPEPTFATVRDPLSYFVILDRTAGSDRLGVQVGAGGPGDLSLGSSRRIEAFGLYTPGDIGVYGQVAHTSLDSKVGTIRSPLSVEGGGRYRQSIPEIGTVSVRAGLLANAGDGDSESFVAGAAGSFNRPSDAAASMNAAVTLRASGSIVHTASLFVVQADLGLDGALQTDSSAFEPVGRFNVGAGVGAPRAFVGIELVNTMVLSATSRRLHALGIGGAFRVGKVLVQGLVSRVYNTDTSLTLGASYEL